MRPITLLTDFGTSDAYVGAVKGAILSVNPGASIVDISHEVPPQDILSGAFLLGTAYASFPPGTVHLAVVDPGVGTRRRAVLLATPSAFFLAPDNGLLTFVLGDLERRGRRRPALRGRRLAGAFGAPYRARVPRGCAAFALTEPRLWRHPVSRTFHGRDIFAPVAGHLSLGTPPQACGRPVASLARLFLPGPERAGAGTVRGHVLHIDRFGNVVTDLRPSDIPRGDVVVEVAGQRIQGVSRTYAEGQGLLALVDSAGYLEIAQREGSAARALGVRRGDAMTVGRV